MGNAVSVKSISRRKFVTRSLLINRIFQTTGLGNLKSWFESLEQTLVFWSSVYISTLDIPHTLQWASRCPPNCPFPYHWFHLSPCPKASRSVQPFFVGFMVVTNRQTHVPWNISNNRLHLMLCIVMQPNNGVLSHA